MHQWRTYFTRGCRALRDHQPIAAARWFQAARRAMDDSRSRSGRSPHSRADRARVLTYLGISYRRAGMRNRALQAWVESCSVVKRGPIRRRLEHCTNGYGMAGQLSTELDDRHAFYGVQLARYLRSKKSHRLGTRAEVDMVVELIDEHWRQICEHETIATMTFSERLSLFRSTTIVFPFLSVPESMAGEDVAVDFCHGTRIGPANRCVCGSGLRYEICHGRIPGLDEVLAGRF